ncbi:hypothetical protein BDV98DRAFT_587209 [Pterulicium gracile]|uniref:Uncharacterized protein n=1 Tax=Pterulicium gracile TaxID=1884261 RepID=A0A5C3Q9Y1_9AGAR|nr:hypothetical protein BDV98DRAFT_587209 [Pterula gracilis]
MLRPQKLMNLLVLMVLLHQFSNLDVLATELSLSTSSQGPNTLAQHSFWSPRTFLLSACTHSTAQPDYQARDTEDFVPWKTLGWTRMLLPNAITPEAGHKSPTQSDVNSGTGTPTTSQHQMSKHKRQEAKDYSDNGENELVVDERVQTHLSTGKSRCKALSHEYAAGLTSKLSGAGGSNPEAAKRLHKQRRRTEQGCASESQKAAEANFIIVKPTVSKQEKETLLDNSNQGWWMRIDAEAVGQDFPWDQTSVGLVWLLWSSKATYSNTHLDASGDYSAVESAGASKLWVIGTLLDCLQPRTSFTCCLEHYMWCTLQNKGSITVNILYVGDDCQYYIQLLRKQMLCPAMSNTSHSGMENMFVVHLFWEMYRVNVWSESSSVYGDCLKINKINITNLICMIAIAMFMMLSYITNFWLQNTILFANQLQDYYILKPVTKHRDNTTSNVNMNMKDALFYGPILCTSNAFGTGLKAHSLHSSPATSDQEDNHKIREKQQKAKGSANVMLDYVKPKLAGIKEVIKQHGLEETEEK